MKEEILDKHFVEGLIPQRQPFVMVDKLLFYSPDKVVAGLTVPSFNIFVKDSVFTEPGLIEHIAQSVALHTGYQYFLNDEPSPTGYLGAIKKVEIFSLPSVADNLVTTITIMHQIMEVTLIKAETVCEGSPIARSEMKTVLLD